jgi:hypothetical protein
MPANGDRTTTVPTMTVVLLPRLSRTRSWNW